MIRLLTSVFIGQKYNIKDSACPQKEAILIGTYKHHLVFNANGISYSISKASILCGDAVVFDAIKQERLIVTNI